MHPFSLTLNPLFIHSVGQSFTHIFIVSRCWASFLDGQAKVMKWIQDAQILIAVKHIESKENVETHKDFFIANNDKLMQDFVQSAQVTGYLSMYLTI